MGGKQGEGELSTCVRFCLQEFFDMPQTSLAGPYMPKAGCGANIWAGDLGPVSALAGSLGATGVCGAAGVGEFVRGLCSVPGC